MRFTTADNMAEIDYETIENYRIDETALMETAGSLTARHACKEFLNGNRREKVVVFTGKGHNGADGLVVARWLNQWDFEVEVITSCPLDESDELTRQQAVSLEKNPDLTMKVYDSGQELPPANLYIDALLGTGLSGNPRPPIDQMISRMNHSTIPVVSVDIPSGLSGNRPMPYDPSIHANLTITFGLPKLGMLFEPGYTTTGRIIVQELGFPEETYDQKAGSYHLITARDMKPHAPIRHLTDHKGDSGRLAVVAGSKKYPGAAFLTARAASEIGAGLTSLIGPQDLTTNQTDREREIVFPLNLNDLFGSNTEIQDNQPFFDTQDAVAIGPGLGQDERIHKNLSDLLSMIHSPVVIDADGLNNFSDKPEILAQCNEGILTPHPGEAARLLGESVQTVQKNPKESCRKLHKITGQTIILKTSRPIVYHKDGTISVNVTGTPALAKGGSGDVLTGLIAGLLAQGLSTAEACCMGLYLHGSTAVHAESRKPTVTIRAPDLIDAIPEAFSELRNGDNPEWFPIEFESISPSVLQWNPLP